MTTQSPKLTRWMIKLGGEVRSLRQQAAYLPPVALEKDAVMYPYMNAVKELVVSGRIVLAVNQKVEDIWEL